MKSTPHTDGGSRPFTLTRRSFVLAGIGAIASGSSRAHPGEQRVVTLGAVSLSFYAVTGAIVREVLERLGHPVVVRQGTHEQIFPMLADGAIDLMAAAWLPGGHAAYWAHYGARATEVAQLYQGARFFWAVPSYIPEDQLHSIDGLAQPSVMRRMPRTIQGIGTGAAITSLSEQAIEVYGLESAGYILRPGTQQEWLDAVNTALTGGRWVVFPTWAPQYLNKDGALRALQDPLNVLGGVNHASLVAPRDRFQTLPVRTRKVLSRIDIGMDGVTAMDWSVNVGKLTERDAAREWMANNSQRVDGWFAI
ncbi:hypothetical protein KPL74_06225 [Bacillus sp. NP157]|nr:hypothetical protein KPL74_06225 [Bacillus sp. NP157]